MTDGSSTCKRTHATTSASPADSDAASTRALLHQSLHQPLPAVTPRDPNYTCPCIVRRTNSPRDVDERDVTDRVIDHIGRCRPPTRVVEADRGRSGQPGQLQQPSHGGPGQHVPQSVGRSTDGRWPSIVVARRQTTRAEWTPRRSVDGGWRETSDEVTLDAQHRQ